jgi:nucleotide-binding universal stress UspA family protein
VYERILVGTDGSRTAAKAVDRAVELAAATGARLTVLTVGGEAKALLTAESEVARHRESGVAIEAMAIDGDPASVLLDEAERGRYDLLVMGNKGMTGVSRFLMGSVPNKVSHHASSTVLIVRTTGGGH